MRNFLILDSKYIFAIKERNNNMGITKEGVYLTFGQK